ncbi:transmembrane protein 116 [Exaiptasia diaphana]|uniref:G-protein coupled receptors family 1 profile domain-containing protein n=1 Tax=Exaiptasia diaphana TaxID=2652724 RepID=A0A913Y622_EXADI|nr:transmembrane protein 116 [Exaiptasia diaphana]KXJ28987.1 Transmembrane protein 116 [Exaiptasia diaphana]
MTTNMADVLSGANVKELMGAIFPNSTFIPMTTLCCDPYKSKVDVVASLYIFTSLLSILGTGSIISCSLWNKIANSSEVHPLFHLALANFLLALTWFVGGIAWVSKSKMNCFYVEVFGEMFLIMSFFLTVNYGINVYIRLRGKTHNLEHLNFSTVSTSNLYKWLFRGLYIASWVIPVITVAPLIYKYKQQREEMKEEPSCSRCLLLFDRPNLRNQEGGVAWAMYDSILMIICLVPSILLLIVLYIMTERIHRKCLRRRGIHTDSQRKSMSNMRKRIILYIMVFIFCWTPALIVAIMEVARKLKTKDSDWELSCRTYIMQSVSAPLQGFLNSIVYGWTRKSFRRATRSRNDAAQRDYGSMLPIT